MPATRQLKRTKWSFQACAAYIAAGKHSLRRKLANNTYLLAIPKLPLNFLDTNKEQPITHYAIRLHSTDVVEIYPDNSVKLFSGGFRTVTTKQRINSFSPLGVYQFSRTWYLTPDVEFYEGVHISADGTIIPPA